MHDLDGHGLVVGDGVVDHGSALVGSHHRRIEYGKDTFRRWARLIQVSRLSKQYSP
jgi:hypothetical protein